jgi:hypothetical protein
VGLYELGAFPEKSVPRDAGSRRRYTACLLVHDAPCLILPGRLPIVALPRKRGLALAISAPRTLDPHGFRRFSSLSSESRGLALLHDRR